ncbi:MAG: hypothetical protein COX17_02505 [Deltaproteobacteria bacterium CG23_combo_of_CG06-09_8_20_14_all_60_8]|nr:MAG: hypothetical protein AUK28_06280 [Desulfobacterales bacterium CG2_30_60_27]PIP44249.1 MAG: hypothetical protein COX17_02505 [Deltaproteobacteria bacterium CG23_combo_of_CG06-09_8_20_14_all_60_8]
MIYHTTCRHSLLVLCLLALFSLEGCATNTKQIFLRYDPITTLRSEGGNLYLVNTEPQPPSASGLWMIGNTKSSDNQIIGNLWSGLSPASLVQNALDRELERTGYKVIPQKKTPDPAAMVVEISTAAIDIEQTSKLSRIDADCTITVSLTIKKSGAPVRTLYYEAKGSDLAIKNRDQLAETMLRITMQDVMRQAIPDIVKHLAQ